MCISYFFVFFCWCRAREYESMMGETNYNSNKSILMMIIWNGTTLTHAINLQDYGSVHDDSVSLGRTSVQESVNTIKPINASHHYPHLFIPFFSLSYILKGHADRLSKRKTLCLLQNAIFNASKFTPIWLVRLTIELVFMHMCLFFVRLRNRRTFVSLTHLQLIKNKCYCPFLIL
jgi:hypothetical protein